MQANCSWNSGLQLFVSTDFSKCHSMSLRLSSICHLLKIPLFPSPVYIVPVRYSSEVSFAKLKQAYINLGLDESASLDDIKSRFAKLAKLYHPDTGGAEVYKRFNV